MARPERFELPTPRFVVWCSIQLSYGRIVARHAGSIGRQAPGARAIAIGFPLRWQVGLLLNTKSNNDCIMHLTGVTRVTYGLGIIHHCAMAAHEDGTAAAVSVRE